MGKKTLLIIIIAFVVVIAAALVLYNTLTDKADMDSVSMPQPTNEEPEKTEQAEQTNPTEQSKEDPEPAKIAAPDITIEDMEGNKVQFSEFLGKPVVLNFWTSWCGFCRVEMPDFEQAYLERKDEIEFVMLNAPDGTRETVEIAKAFLEEKGYTFPVYFDTEFEAVIKYGVRGYPITFFIDEEGYIFAYKNGMVEKETLDEILDMMLAE
ncbi:MAG: TlpA family protein disulfide reductase [Christensenellaceae bacterium]|nr:TlpA family protein disulfide reductase [Christensenellaceae bacterium]